MVITEVRIKLCEENNERLLAFCSVTFDNAFVVRDLKIIEGTKGMFVAMPSRKLTDRCNRCGGKNHLRARFCNPVARDSTSSAPSATPTAAPNCTRTLPTRSTRAARELIQNAVIKAYDDEKEQSKLPGYVCTYDEYDYDDDVPVSYSGVVSEMGKSVKSHAAHAAPKGTHFHTSDAPTAKAARPSDGFADGIA